MKMAKSVLVMDELAYKPMYKRTKLLHIMVSSLVKMVESLFIMDNLAYQLAYGTVKNMIN